MGYLWYLLIFMLGAAVGSFVNVLVERSMKGKSWVSGRSKCDYCGRILSWHELVPILSYLWQRGRSHCCKKKLGWHHVVVEGMFGLLFVWWLVLSSAIFLLVSKWGGGLQPVFWLVSWIILLIIAIVDARWGVIPLLYLLFGILLVVIYRVILMVTGEYMLADFGISILVGILGSGFYQFLRLITKGKGMGEGDVYLAFYLGLLSGWPRMMVATLSGFVIGALIASLMMIFGKKTMKATIAFGPFMIMGLGVSLLWSEQLLGLMGF